MSSAPSAIALFLNMSKGMVKGLMAAYVDDF